MLLLAVIHVLLLYWLYRKTGGLQVYTVLAGAIAAYCILLWMSGFTSMRILKEYEDHVTAGFSCLVLYFMYLYGSRLFTWTRTVAMRILVLLIFLTLHYGVWAFSNETYYRYSKLLLLIFTGATLILLTADWVKRRNEENRTLHSAVGIFFLSPVWLLLSNLFPEFSANGLEWTTIAITIYMGGLLIRGVEKTKKSEGPHDVSPSMRIANSGVQILNHSFKNKLLTIEMAVGTLRSKLVSPGEYHQEMYLIEQSVEHLKQMVQRLRERTKSIVLQERTMNLEALLHTVREELIPIIPSTIQLEMGGSLNAIILCDPVHMKEVLHNIIMNSVEAIGRKEGLIRIYLHPPIPHNWLTLCIEDSGPGVPTSSVSRVFEPYFTTKAGATNYGLGLSYCYNVMRASSCSIKLNSAPDKGTTVILSFPPKKVLVYPEFK